MPLYVLSKEHHFDEIILERRLNIIAFTVCWSLGSKMIFPTIFDLSTDQNLTHVNFYRIDTDENNLELNGVDLEQFIHKTHHLAIVKKFFFILRVGLRPTREILS